MNIRSGRNALHDRVLVMAIGARSVAGNRFTRINGTVRIMHADLVQVLQDVLGASARAVVTRQAGRRDAIAGEQIGPTWGSVSSMTARAVSVLSHGRC